MPNEVGVAVKKEGLVEVVVIAQVNGVVHETTRFEVGRHGGDELMRMGDVFEDGGGVNDVDFVTKVVEILGVEGDEFATEGVVLGEDFGGDLGIVGGEKSDFLRSWCEGFIGV